MLSAPEVIRKEKVPLTKRMSMDKLAFTNRYIAFLFAAINDYYNEDLDRVDIENYYKNVNLDYKSLSHLVSSTYRKGDRRVGLWALVDRQPDGRLLCAYSGKEIETAECVRLCKADEEHIVPQSWHKGSKTHPGRDMHQIFVVTKGSNGSRGNRIFGKGEGKSTQKEGGTVYSDGFFIPHENLGAVCRATLYTLLAYPKSFHKSYRGNSELPTDYISWIKINAVSEPVTLWEKHRNRELYKLQGNRNPFIDNPNWAIMIEFDEAFV